MAELSETPPVEAWMHPEVQHVRRQSRDYLAELKLNVASFEDVATLGATALDGGVMSACYLAPNGGQSASCVVKLSIGSNLTEGDILMEWRAAGVKVPEVYDYGFVASTIDTPIPVRYTLMEAILGEQGEPAPTVAANAVTEPEVSELAGKLMGIELNKIHQEVSSDIEFGARSIIDEFHNPAPGWGEFLREEMQRFTPSLTKLGYDIAQIETLLKRIPELPFAATGKYLHNDPSPRNILISTRDPLDICIIDPNPIIGNNHWDFAHMLNQLTSAKKRYDQGDKQGKYQQACQAQEDYYLQARDTYEIVSAELLDDLLLLACQLPRSLKKYAWFSRPHQKSFELQIAQNVVVEQVDKLLRNIN